MRQGVRNATLNAARRFHAWRMFQSRQSSSSRRPLSWRHGRVVALLGTTVGISILLSLAAPPVMAEGADAGSDCMWHTVVPGDTLGNLGWSNHTTAVAIVQANQIADPNLIYVGQRLCIPRHSTSLAGSPQCIWHRVVSGDTLGNLGSRYHSNALTIAQANLIPNPNRIFVGQYLCIPDPPGASASRTPASSAPASSDFASQAPLTTVMPDPAPNGGSASGVRAFVKLVLPYARAAHAATGWPTSLILAQWGIEQGWHVPGYTGYNFGNCGAVPGEPLVPGLKVAGSPAAFAYAPTPNDGLRIYVEVAHLGFYAAVAPAASGGVDAAARALGQSPWDAAHYTAPGGDPGSSLIAVLHAYNLYQYDTH